MDELDEEYKEQVYRVMEYYFKLRQLVNDSNYKVLEDMLNQSPVEQYDHMLHAAYKQLKKNLGVI